MLTSFQKSTDIRLLRAARHPAQADRRGQEGARHPWHNAPDRRGRVAQRCCSTRTRPSAAALDVLGARNRRRRWARCCRARCSGAARLRMMEVFNHRIYKIFNEHDEIDAINDQYWTIRAEEGDAGESPSGRRRQADPVRHFCREQRGPPRASERPLPARRGADETAARARGSRRSSAPPPQGQRRFAICSFGRVMYGEDDEIVRTRFRARTVRARQLGRPPGPRRVAPNRRACARASTCASARPPTAAATVCAARRVDGGARARPRARELAAPPPNSDGARLPRRWRVEGRSSFSPSAASRSRIVAAGGMAASARPARAAAAIGGAPASRSSAPSTTSRSPRLLAAQKSVRAASLAMRPRG